MSAINQDLSNQRINTSLALTSMTAFAFSAFELLSKKTWTSTANLFFLMGAGGLVSYLARTRSFEKNGNPNYSEIAKVGAAVFGLGAGLAIYALTPVMPKGVCYINGAYTKC